MGRLNPTQKVLAAALIAGVRRGLRRAAIEEIRGILTEGVGNVFDLDLPHLLLMFRADITDDVRNMLLRRDYAGVEFAVPSAVREREDDEQGRHSGHEDDCDAGE
jgi:hypothetical protein